MRAPPPAIAALIENARCFNCLPPSTQFEVQTYIMAYVLGESVDPKELANAAKDFQALNAQTLQEIKAYLLATIAGYNVSPNSLAERAKCYICIPDGMISDVQTYLLSIDPSGPGITSTNALAAAAKAFMDWPIQTLLEIQIYILARLSNSSTNPNELADAAKCISCLPLPVISEVSVAALDYLEAGGGGGLNPGGGGCTIGVAPLISNEVYTNGIIFSVDATGCACANAFDWVIYGSNFPDGSGAIELATWADTGTQGQLVSETIPIPVPVAFDYYYITMRCGTDESDPSAIIDADLTCGAPSTVIEVTNCGDANANGLYTWDQAEYDSSGRFTYVNSVSNWMIEFTDGGGGVEAVMYNDLLVARYQLPLGTCFPCGPWEPDPAWVVPTYPVPTGAWGTEGLEVASDWADRVVTNGGARPNVNTIYAAMMFYDTLTPTVRGKLKAVNIFAPDSWIASQTPLIKIWGGTTWNKVNAVAVGFGGADAGIWGIEVDPSTGIWTSFNPSAHADCSVSDFGCTFYTNHPDFAIASFGGRSASNYFTVYPSFVGTWYFDWPDNGGASRITATIPTRFRGFVSYNRSASNRADVWYANSNTPFASGGFDTDAIVNGKPNAVLYLGAFNDTGTFQGGACRGYGFCAFHTALTATESEELYDAVEQLRRDIGGGYVPDTTVASEVVTEMANNISYQSGAAMAAGTVTALETFWDDLIAAGIQDKMLVVVPFVPDNLTAARTPLIGIGSNRNLTNAGTGFVAGDLTVNGLAGDAVGKYLSLVHFIPSRLFFDANDIGISLYIYTGKNEASNDGATAQSPAYASAYGVQNYSNNMYSDLGPAGATGRIGPIADAAATGYYSGNRTAANAHYLYKAKSTFAHASIGSNLNVSADVRSLVTGAMYLFAYNMAGAAGYSSKRVSFWAVHLGLSSAQSLAFYNAIQALRTSLGGGFV